MSELRKGIRASWPIVLSAGPFGLLFGALAVENGFTVLEATLMSALVFAGASQMVGLELFGAHIAPWIVVASIFIVNIRHLLYSAVTGRNMVGFSGPQKLLGLFFLTDPQFATTEKHVEQGNQLTFAWYMGLALPVYVAWVIEGYVGAVFGNLIKEPARYGVDFLVVIYFLGLVMSFRNRLNWLPVVVVSGLTSLAAFHLIGSPWHVSIGALFGVLIAAALGGPKNHKPVV